MFTYRPVLLTEQTLQDLNYDAAVEEASKSCVTEGGAKAIRNILTSPTYCLDTLKARSKDISSLAPKAAGLTRSLEKLKPDERAAAWCSVSPEEMDEDTFDMLKEPFFKGYGKPLNKVWPAIWANNTYAMFAAPALALAAPMAYLIAPFLLIRFKLKIPLDFKTFVKLMYHSFKGAGAALNIAFGNAPSFAMQLTSVVCTCVMYFQAVIASFRHSLKLVGVCRRVVSHMNALSRFLDHSDDLLCDERSDFFSRWVPGYEDAKNTGPRPSVRPESLRPWKTGYAIALKEYEALDKDWIRCRMRQTFYLDAVLALCKTVARLNLTRVQWIDGAILLKGGSRLTDSDQSNDVALSKKKNGLVLTGKNASGKSTYLRMIGCNVLFAHATGFAPAKAAAMPAMAYLMTMMGIRDDPEAGRSRFQNELQRAGECVEAAKRRPEDSGLLLMDEIFGGTDPSQGDVCGSKVMSSLTDGCMYVLATHQKGLVKHSETMDNTTRMRMTEGYKIVPGVNEGANALHLFEEKHVTS